MVILTRAPKTKGTLADVVVHRALATVGPAAIPALRPTIVALAIAVLSASPT